MKKHFPILRDSNFGQFSVNDDLESDSNNFYVINSSFKLENDKVEIHVVKIKFFFLSKKVQAGQHRFRNETLIAV